MVKKICISGYYGFDNFGDETILKILVENLKKISCNAQITVFSSNPQKTEQIYNVKSVNSFKIIEVIKAIFSSDCLISGGGSLLQDVTSKKSIIYYLGVIFLALMFRKKVIIFAQGIGPVNNKILAFFTALLLKKADLITVRDKKSYELLKSQGINSFETSDPVWNIDLNLPAKTGKIGIQLREFKGFDDDFLYKLADCVNEYFFNREIVLLPLQNKLDFKICSKFESYLKKINPQLKVSIAENISNENIINNIVELDSLIAMRYHACLIAIKSNVKLLPVNYDIKIEELNKEFNLKCINISDKEKMDEIIKNFVNSQIEYNQEKINNKRFDFELISNVI